MEEKNIITAEEAKSIADDASKITDSNNFKKLDPVMDKIKDAAKLGKRYTFVELDSTFSTYVKEKLESWGYFVDLKKLSGDSEITEAKISWR